MSGPLTCACGRELLTEEEMAGGRTRCLNCGRELPIPEPVANPPTNPAIPPADNPEWEAVGPSKWRPQPIRNWVDSRLLHGLLGFIFLGIVVGLFIPSRMVQLGPNRRTTCQNNLKHIGIAMQMYATMNGRLPPAAIRDKAGKPILSWRVAILPQLEMWAVYDQFHLDEPWDSPHNRALMVHMPSVYACPSPGTRREMTTTYQVFVGPGTAFDGPDGTHLAAIRDGQSRTILVVEADQAVPWTRPDDLHYDPNGPLPPIGHPHNNGTNVLCVDTSVRYLRQEKASESVLRALITINGNEPLDPNTFP